MGLFDREHQCMLTVLCHLQYACGSVLKAFVSNISLTNFMYSYSCFLKTEAYTSAVGYSCLREPWSKILYACEDSARPFDGPLLHCLAHTFNIASHSLAVYFHTGDRYALVRSLRTF